MKLIALLLGLFLEKFSTNLFNLREMRWLDRYFDEGLALLEKRSKWQGLLVAVLVVFLAVLPVALLAHVVDDLMGGLLWLALSIAVLFASLGPRDLEAEVDEFVDAVKNTDRDATHRVAKELLEFEPPEGDEEMGASVASAVFKQSNNRTFGVVLWFVLLGPVGAWAFRVTDLFRRRASFESIRRQEHSQEHADYVCPVRTLHGVLAWLPSRITAMSFALAGSFEPATTAWKSYYTENAQLFYEVNDDIVASAGCGALGRSAREDMINSPEVGARGAMDLVQRSMIVWLVVFALLTIAGAAI